MKKMGFALCAVGMLSACGGGMEITAPPVDVTRTANFDTANFVGDHPTNVRTYFEKKKANGGTDRVEFAGATCQVKGRGFQASFATPAILNLPDHGFYSQAVTGKCTVGDTVRPVVARPYNITVANIKSNTGAGGGVLGMVVAGVANGIALAANDPTNDDYGYRPISVAFPDSAKAQ